jgi:glycosyltransferase involved in cell wall biosynthesis
VKLLVLGKFPPIEGGVSAQTFWLCRELAAQGHAVDVVTNAGEVDPTLAQLQYGDDSDWLLAGGSEGTLRVHHTTPVQPGSFIPFSQPYVSKLFGLALLALDRHACDVVLSWYFEPYGLVAALVGQATGVPYVMRHAGSDLARLARHPQLREAYRWAARRAAGLVVTNEYEFEARLGSIDRPRIRVARPHLPDVFRAPSASLDLSELLDAADSWFAAAGLPEELVRRIRLANARPLRPDLFTLGTYGKVGVTKGSFDLVAALANTAASGAEFAFLTLSCGRREVLTGYYEAIMASEALAERTWFLPPVMPWRVPGFLAACDAVCFLERDFAIPSHGPLVPHEVLSSAACLVCSAEVASKPAYGGNLVHDRNAVVIPDPSDRHRLSAEIGALVEDCDRAAGIGRQGQKLSRFWDEDLQSFEGASRAFAAEVATAAERHDTLR